LSACTRCDIELALLMDASSSTEWQNFLNMLRSLVGNFNIGQACVRTAAIRYSDNAQVAFGLTSHSNLASLQQAIQSLAVLGGNSNLLSALQTLRTQVFTNSIVRTRAWLVAGIITDRLTCSSQLITEANNLKKLGVILLGIGFTSSGRVDKNCFSQIVTANQWIDVTVSSQYSNHVSTAAAAVCPPDYWSKSSFIALSNQCTQYN